MIITRENWGNKNLRTYCEIHGYGIGDDIWIADYINFIDKKSIEFEKLFGIEHSEKFSEWLRSGGRR